MSKRDVKKDELLRFAELIMACHDRKEMMQKLNGFTCGLYNGHPKRKRVEVLKNLIEIYQ